MTETDFLLRLRPEPSQTPPIIRVRSALKRIKRDFGLRCVAFREVPREPPDTALTTDLETK